MGFGGHRFSESLHVGFQSGELGCLGVFFFLNNVDAYIYIYIIYWFNMFTLSTKNMLLYFVHGFDKISSKLRKNRKIASNFIFDFTIKVPIWHHMRILCEFRILRTLCI